MMIEANSSIVEPNASLGHNQLEKVNNTLGATAKAQPPLPPNPPPPDSPPMIINLKQEIEDDDYKGSTSTEISSDFSQSEEIKATAAVIKTDNSEEKPGVTMCRNFARGTCKKGAACIFAHELILSQLPGVYTFCRNFQNSVCSFPKCKFVHATVFEKEHFFRTGYLPPHTLAHLKETTVVQQPPPPSRTEGNTYDLFTKYYVYHYKILQNIMCNNFFFQNLRQSTLQFIVMLHQVLQYHGKSLITIIIVTNNTIYIILAFACSYSC